MRTRGAGKFDDSSWLWISRRSLLQKGLPFGIGRRQLRIRALATQNIDNGCTKLPGTLAIDRTLDAMDTCMRRSLQMPVQFEVNET